MQLGFCLKVTIIFTCILKLRSQEKVEDQGWEHLWRESISLPAALGTFTDIAPGLLVSAHQQGRGYYCLYLADGGPKAHRDWHFLSASWCAVQSGFELRLV